MDTLLIEVTNQKAMGLLHELEELQLIKVIRQNMQPKQKLSEKYAGKLSPEIADELQLYISKSRDEWNDRSI